MKRTVLSRISASVVLSLLLLMSLSACSDGNNATFTASIGIAREAVVTIDIPYERSTINPINTNSINFFEGQLDAMGDIQFSVEGEEIRRATVSENVPEDLDLSGLIPLWSIRLTTQLPLELDLTNGGSLNTDLRPFTNFTALNYTQTGGDGNIILPTGENLEQMSITQSGGMLNVVTPANASFASDVAISDGEMILNVPTEGSVRLNFVAENAEITLPETYTTTDTEEGFTASYVSELFSEDADSITYNIDATGGTLSIQYRPPASPAEVVDDDAEALDATDDTTDETATDDAEATDETAGETATDDAEATDDTADESATDDAEATDDTTDETATDDAEATDETADETATDDAEATDETTDETATDDAGATDETTDETATDDTEATDETADETATDDAEATDDTTDETATDDAEATDETAEETAAAEDVELPATLLEAIRDEEELETFIQAVSNVGLKDAMSGEGPITVFAPTNEAFVEAAESLAMGVEGLLEETTTLSIYLNFHVIEGTVLSSDIEDGMRATSLQGSDLVFSIDEDGVVTVNGAEVITADIVAENGVIHIIDAVLIPE